LKAFEAFRSRPSRSSDNSITVANSCSNSCEARRSSSQSCRHKLAADSPPPPAIEMGSKGNPASKRYNKV
jgi:hypothetical protein